MIFLIMANISLQIILIVLEEEKYKAFTYYKDTVIFLYIHLSLLIYIYIYIYIHTHTQRMTH